MTGTVPAVLATSGIVKRFPGVLALDAVSLGFLPGEVHAVVGENGAGKSTLMHVLAGDLSPDEGEVLVDGEPIEIRSSLQSRTLGITVVYQELSLCPNLSVAENVTMGELAERSPLSLARRGRTRERARAVLGRLGMEGLEPDRKVGTLTVAQMQLVEIARAISRRARVLVLDEPNSALSPRESERLFDVVRQLRAEGTSVIYVSHHLEEVLALADRVSVLRDGRHVTTLGRDEVTVERLIGAMVGRGVDAAEQWSVQAGADARARPGALEVRGLSSGSDVGDVSFTLHEGEILGVGGLPGSGKDELVGALFGLAPRSGEVRLGGRTLAARAPEQSLRQGVALIPADRRGAGALLSMSVAQNIVSASLARFSRLGFVRGGEVLRESARQVRRFDARVSSLAQKVRTLSGGNQQKIILIRGLVTSPRVLILHEPTRGIDVGAKAEIYAILKELAGDGVALLLVSSELPELVMHCSRVLVLAEGRLTGELSGAAITEEALLERALASAANEGEVAA